MMFYPSFLIVDLIESNNIEDERLLNLIFRTNLFMEMLLLRRLNLNLISIMKDYENYFKFKFKKIIVAPRF